MRTWLTCGAVLLCTLAGAGACAQDIGRLFTTPEERNALQRMRYGAPAASLPVTASAAVQPGGLSAAVPLAVPAAPGRAVAQGDQVMVINGIVRRSGPGRNTTWIDSVPYSENARVAGGVALARGASNASVALTLRSGRQVSVKPGQRIDARSGRIGESYQELPARVPRVSEPEVRPE